MPPGLSFSSASGNGTLTTEVTAAGAAAQQVVDQATEAGQKAMDQVAKSTQETVDKTANQASETFSGFGKKLGLLK
ncbi:PREDICTED: adipogenesis regulatory factor [Miniopterus natalensis]|uniref:adipogenesis regulatory factor n=1 Tax=Miniopterus natalensis TaxID=291302 RepID=UPI0007A71EC7|nr:PREDICTED: adipogenesis regulatory factor [Miniopterus natalensis]